MKPYILYPRGSGGSWLSNLIWHLEHGSTAVPQVDTVFDHTAQGSIAVTHGFEIPDPHSVNQRVNTAHSGPAVLFSTPCVFNHYINNAVKVKYHIHQLGQRSLRDQLFELSNGAHYYLTNDHYRSVYCGTPDLDAALIFQCPEEFANQLYCVLNKFNIRYTANTHYVLASIAHYRNTCPRPQQHYNNPQSLLWLGACHAVSTVYNIQLPAVIEPSCDQQTMAEILQCTVEPACELWHREMFEWKP